MANFDFFLSKACELRYRAEALRNTLDLFGSRHPAIASSIRDKFDKLNNDIELIWKVALTNNPVYLPRLSVMHRLCEKTARNLADSVGIILREGPSEQTMSILLNRLCSECGFTPGDFLVCFFPYGPAIRMLERNPVFYVRDECLSSSYSWLPFYHEIGHAITKLHRHEIIVPLVLVIRDYYDQLRNSVGPIPAGSLSKHHKATTEAEDYWTSGENIARLEELFCDCFATYATGIAYPHYWVDLGAGFVEHPRFVDEHDAHPPFLARLEACLYVLPDFLKNSDYGKVLEKLASDYINSSQHFTNPQLEYGTVCHPALIEKLAGKSVELIRQYWSHLQQYQNPPSTTIDTASDVTIAFLLNAVVAALIADPVEYPGCEKEALQIILHQ